MSNTPYCLLCKTEKRKKYVGPLLTQSSVTSIGDYAFYKCTGLTEITIPDSVTTISDWTFSECGKLNRISIPDSVEKIDDCAFRGCESLERILIPKSVSELGWGVFDECSDNLVVYCDEGTEIHAYCERNKIKNDRICNMETN